MPSGSLVRRILYPTIYSIPIGLWQKLLKLRFICPFYHIVSDEDVVHVKHLYKYKNISQFNTDLEFLLNNYHFICLEDLILSIKSGKEIPRKSIFLSFDDGFREMYDIVAPLLRKKGIPAAFFVTKDFIDNKDLSYLNKISIIIEHLNREKPHSDQIQRILELLAKKGLSENGIDAGLCSIRYSNKKIVEEIREILGLDFEEYLRTRQPYLTSEQIDRLINYGFSIGSHSIDHPLFSSLSLDEQIRQTKESMLYVKERFRLGYGAFAFPHNDRNVSRGYFDEIFKSGLVDITFGTDDMRSDIIPFSVQRFSLEKPMLPADKIIALEYAKKLSWLLFRSDRIERI